MSDGIKTALAEAHDLFREGAAEGGERRSGPQGGRPKGARNRSTEAWKRFLLQRYDSPLEGALRMAQMTLDEIVATAARLNCAPLEVYKIAASMRVAAMPFLHQKQPLAVQAVGDKRGVLVIGELTVNAASAAGLALPLAAEIEENQRVIEGGLAASDAYQSDEAPNQLELHGNVADAG